MSSIQKISKILGVDVKILERMNAYMEKITGKTGVFDSIIYSNNNTIEKILNKFGIILGNSDAVSRLILDNLRSIDNELFNVLDRPDLRSVSGATALISAAYKATPEDDIGFFLKKDKAREMLLNTPPPNIIAGLKYKNARELLEKEKLEEVFPAIRFFETREWMNNIFLPEYKKFKTSDFEHRPIDLIVLSEKWLKLTKNFMHKKYHNVSHLKELGIVFIIPIEIDTPGQTLRMFSLLLHYLYEVPFYSKLIKNYSKRSEKFADKLISLLRGDVIESTNYELQITNDKFILPIVQRYLIKDDSQDKRLFMPHINPEAIHWKKAQNVLIGFMKKQGFDISYLRNIDFVGDFFPIDHKQELISFDLVDNVMSLVEKRKFTYHYKEALWNKIFSEFIGGDKKIEEMIINNMDKGYIELNFK